MLDFILMLHVKLPLVDRIHPESNNFAMGVENKATSDSKLNVSTAIQEIITKANANFTHQKCSEH